MARPDNWQWSFLISSGGPVYNTVLSGNTLIQYIMTAAEWNAFTAKIEEFRAYKGLSVYGFTTVTPGMDFSYQYMNQAISAINGFGYTESFVTWNSQIQAYTFIRLKALINIL